MNRLHGPYTLCSIIAVYCVSLKCSGPRVVHLPKTLSDIIESPEIQKHLPLLMAMSHILQTVDLTLKVDSDPEYSSHDAYFSVSACQSKAAAISWKGCEEELVMVASPRFQNDILRLADRAHPCDR